MKQTYLLLILVATHFALAAQQPNHPSAPATLIGTTIADIAGIDPASIKILISAATLADKFALIDFRASWCGPC